ncbi:hypothetical protein [Hymenobacter lapidiphilus]|uniref:Uncharacterized protein n=1 Tax=Hymenobacter lapidiphilus TaxID=2608003 RepID=A0A7Y7U6H5_9BACT|nr:hypothetical protein [Hymenobacter lapidiphilus]NVO32412.1 hypothetical protein [Hymenobacter lapidiphilus]
MSQIDKKLSGFLYDGADLELATAPFKSRIGIVYGFNPAGTAYTSYKPTSQFNSLSVLKQDASYILSTPTPGFELPGAMVVAAAVPAPVDHSQPIGGFTVTATARAGQAITNPDVGWAEMVDFMAQPERAGNDGFSIGINVEQTTSGYSDSNGLQLHVVRNGVLVATLGVQSVVFGLPYRISDDSGVQVYGYFPADNNAIISYEVPVVDS